MPVLLSNRRTSVTTYNKRQKVKSRYNETSECAFTRCSGGHRFVLDTDTLTDLTFHCEGYSDSLLGEAR